MGRSIPPATQLMLEMVPELGPVYDALPGPQQKKLDKIFEPIVEYKAAFNNSANLLPLEIFLSLAILAERERNDRVIDEIYNNLDKLKKEIKDNSGKE